MNIKVNDTSYEALLLQSRMKDSVWNNRESKAITLAMTYTEAMALFVDDLNWSVESTFVDEDGVESTAVTDMSDYALAGPVTDNRDGTVTVKMGKYLPDELMLIPLAESPKDHKQAAAWRDAIEQAMQTIEDDQTALAAVPLYPAWETLVAANTEVDVGFRFRHDECLYKVLSKHTLSAAWTPGDGTESLYVRIDATHAGTIDDPIPYAGNVELINGLYYVQDDVVYLCNRDTGTPVYNALAELVGLYVEVAE